MEPRTIITFLRKWIWLSLVFMFFAALAAYIFSSRSPKIYSAAAILLVNQGKQVNTNSELAANERLARTFTERLASPPVMYETIRQLGITPSQAENLDVDVAYVRDTQLIRVIVEHHDPEIAQTVANKLPDVFSDRNKAQQSSRFDDIKDNLALETVSLDEEILKLEKMLEASDNLIATNRLESKLQQLYNEQDRLFNDFREIRLEETLNSDAIIVDVPAELPTLPVRPKVMQTTIIAALIGAVTGLGIALLIEILDDTVKPGNAFVQHFGAEPLAQISRVEGEGHRKLVAHAEPRSPIAEAYRMLRTNIYFAAVDRSVKTLVVTSANPSEGKSVTAANLAIVMAQAGNRVLLVDGDLRKPTQHDLFDVTNNVGLTTAIIKQDEPIAQYLKDVQIPGLTLLSSGRLPPNPSELLGSLRMKKVLSTFEEQFDIVIIDTPPVLVVTDSSLLARNASGVLLVVRSNRAHIEEIKRVQNQFKGANAPLLGIVLNDVREQKKKYYEAEGYYYAHLPVKKKARQRAYSTGTNMLTKLRLFLRKG